MRPFLLCAPLCLLASLAAAQPPTAPPPARPSAAPVRAFRAAEPILVDGLLDEATWKVEPSLNGLLQQDPQPGSPETQRTQVWIAYDDEALYVAARMEDTSPDSVVARLARRDNTSGSDHFAILLDTFRDRRTGYFFGLSAAGTQFDGVLLNDSWDDWSWDGVWHGRVHRNNVGWTAEMRVPFSQVRFTSTENMVWGVNVERLVSRRNEEDKLVFTPRGESGNVSRFADLVGLDGVRSQRKIEVLPYTTGKAEYLVHDDGDPFFKDKNRPYSSTVGADLRMGLGSKFVMNATVNPDFGQVEIDPAVVNLSDVESYFQEKRPFFTEGLGIFRCGNNGASDYWGFNWPEPTFFYSRRIGRAPGGSLPDDAVYSDVPLAVRILGAAKITGQPKPGVNVGMVHALTQREQADYQRADLTEGRATVEPLTYYGVWRGLRSFNKERQGLGLMAQQTSRAFDGTGLSDQFNRNNFVGTVDGWTALDGKKDWVASGYVSGTHVDGTKARLTDLQRSSRHYYQRPDRDDLGVDPDATSMQGLSGRVWVNREKGPWFSNSALGFISPGFENNDMGFSSRTDVINNHLGLGYNWSKPNKWRNRWYVLGALAHGWNFAGERTMEQFYLGSNLEQLNGLSWDFATGYMVRSINDRATRGGPTMVNPTGWWGNFFFDTNGKQKLFYWASLNTDLDVEGSHTIYYESGVTWKPRPGLSFTLAPNYTANHQDAQYVTQAADPLATSTYGGRYVFAVLDQKTAAAEVRMDWSLSPGLSLQLYAQPLVSSGRYTEFKELARPGSYEFTVYGRDGGSTLDLGNGTADPDGAGPAPSVTLGDPDFTFRTVRGNVVLRWEYLPGSTAYLVWTQDRTGVTDDGRFSLRPSLNQLARTPANNVFLVKLSHHFEL